MRRGRGKKTYVVAVEMDWVRDRRRVGVLLDHPVGPLGAVSLVGVKV